MQYSKRNGMSRSDFFKVVSAGVCAAGLHSLGVMQALAGTPDKVYWTTLPQMQVAA
jgi:hypothetical protein